MSDDNDIRVRFAEPSQCKTFTIIDTYEILDATDGRASFPGEHIYVMTSKGPRMARLIKRELV